MNACILCTYHSSVLFGTLPLRLCFTLKWTILMKHSRLLGLFIFVALRIRNHFHMVSSESTICNVISVQSLSRSVRQYLWLSDRFLAYFRTEVLTLILEYLLFCSTEPSCPKYLLSRELLVFCQQILVCFILTLRTYALYSRSKRLLICMITVIIVLAGVASAGIFRYHSSNVIVAPGINCYESGASVTLASPGLAWIALFVYELLIFVLTVFRFCKTRGMLRSPYLVMSRNNIADIMFQDGAMYFGVMTLSNIPNILLFYFGSDINRFSLASFTSCMSVTLVSRLMLNLHKSIDSGIFTSYIQDDYYESYILTTRVSIHAQSFIS
ncbi:hypothetical protein BDR07DRAFT_250483 [Suillus spraguei]|nr:hypothetical protein BDR07DRAFT_250483 [Suillus spraguei]